MRNSLLAALAALLLVPAAASADQVTFGSSLAGTPDVIHDKNLADTLFYNTTAHNSHVSPVSGEILAIRVKGRIVPRSPDVDKGNNLWHSQVLRQNGDGSLTVDSSSQHLWFPVGGSENDVHTFVPSTQCVKRGEIVDFNHIGGWNGDPAQPGTRYQIFKRDGSSRMNWYERDEGTNIGATFHPNGQYSTDGQPMTSNTFQPGQPLQEELMMQVVVGNGFDATRLCEGGLQGYEYAGVEVSQRTFTVYDDGVAGARLGCTSGRGFCEGTVRLEIDGTELGRAGFKIDRGNTSNIDIPLTNEGARIVNTRGQVDVIAVADSRDDIGQQRETRGVTTLKSARPTPSGLAGTQLRKQTASVKKGRFTVKATCPLGTAGNCTGRIVLKSQKRVVLKRGTRGKVYTFGKAKYSIAPGKTARIPFKVTSSGKKALKKARKVLAIATTTTSDAAGASTSKRSKVTLKQR